MRCRLHYLFVILILLLPFMPSRGHAQTYFEPCATALSKLSFKTLARYLASHGNLLDAAVSQSSPDKCFRLNDHEFLVLPEGFGIYHCNFAVESVCAEYGAQASRRWQKLDALKEFSDKTGKHFVLLKQVTLEHGVYGETYDMLYLLPPSKETHGLPFTIQFLNAMSTENDSGSLDEDPCGWSSPDAPANVPPAIDAISGVSTGSDQHGHAIVTFRMMEKDCDTNRIAKYALDFDFTGKTFLDVSRNIPESSTARLIRPQGLAVDGKGNLFVALPQSHAVLKVWPDGRLSVLAGGSEGFADGNAGSAKFEMPLFLAVAADGAVLVSDGINNAIRRVTQAGRVSTMQAGSMPIPCGKEVVPDHPGEINSPEGIAVDKAGNIFVACDDHAVREMAASGVITFLAGGQPGYVDGPGKLAKFLNLDSIALSPAGEVYVSDRGNHAVRKVTPDHSVSTLIAGNRDISAFDIPDDEFFEARGLAVATDGGVYASSGNSIFKISPAGVASLFAGGSAGFADGLAAAAHFQNPASLAVDSKGNLFVLDEGNAAIRKITTDGRVTTVVARKRPANAQGCCQSQPN